MSSLQRNTAAIIYHFTHHTLRTAVLLLVHYYTHPQTSLVMQTQSILNLCIPCLASSAQSSIQLCDCQASTQIRAVIIHHQSLILFHQFSIENKDFRLFVNIKLRLGIIITVFTLPSNTGPCTNAEKLGLSKHHRRFRTVT